MGWSNKELAEEAGVDPWELRDNLADGNPAEIIALAQQFHTASGHATDATGIAAKADEITAAGYRVDDTPVHDVSTHLEQTRAQLGGSGENMELIARDLAIIADELADRTTSAKAAVATLDSDLEKVHAALGHVARDAYANPIAIDPATGWFRDYNQEMKELKEAAVGMVRNSGGTVRDLVDGYEEILTNRLKSLADMGYDPPAELDVDDRQPIQNIFDEYQVSTDPNGMVTYPDGPVGLLAKLFSDPKQLTASEARLLDDIGWAGVKDAYDIQEGAATSAESTFGGAGITHGHADAFRHAYWNALLAKRFGEDWTGDFTTAHERKPENRPHEEAMDLHNNEVGRRIWRENPNADPGELALLVEQAVRDGETVVIGRDGNHGYSDRIPIGQTAKDNEVPHIAQPPGADPRDPGTHWSGGYHPGDGVGDDYTTSGDDPR